MEPNDKKSTQSALLRDVEQILPGEFQLLKYIGEGGHGIVFKAFFKPLQREVALKLIKNDGSADTEKQLERMRNEARILARLDHANIVKVLQFSQCKDGTPLLVCEYVEGQTLASYLHANKHLSKDQLKMVFTQLLDALKYSHEHEMIHRDIKPNNIMIVNDSENPVLHVKLLDFGIARDFEQSVQTPLGLTRTIQITGSAPYMSPEQCAGERVDCRSDLYSVACVLFECLAGRPPFAGETPVHTRYMQIHEKPKMPSMDTDADLRSKGELYKLALKALAKNPSDRIRNAAEFKEQFVAACAIAKFGSSTVKKSGTKAFLNGALIGAISSALLFTTFVILSKQFGEKTGLSVEHEQIAERKIAKNSLSPLHNIAEAHKLCGRLTGSPQNTVNRKRLALQAWDIITATIPRIDKTNNGLLFTAWWLKNEAAVALDQPHDALECCKTALKYCRTPDGKETIEAAQCYVSICNMLDKIKGANNYMVGLEMENYARQALRLRRDFEKGTYQSLTVPESINCSDQTGGIWQPLQILLSVEEHRGNNSEALKLAYEIKDVKQKQYGEPAMSSELCEIATILWFMGEREKPKQMIKSQAELLVKSNEVLPVTYYTKLFSWADSHDQDLLHDLLKQCLPHALKHSSNDEGTDLESWQNLYKNWATLRRK